MIRFVIHTLVFYLCCNIYIQGQTTEINLSTNWTLSSKNLNISIQNVTLPTSVHSVLRKQNLIPNPLYRYNDVNLTWIFENDDWTFTNSFKIDNFSVLNKTSRINFIFDSVDTIASIYLNQKFILNVNNQFLRNEVVFLNSILTNDLNILELKFNSPTQVAISLAFVYPYKEPQSNFRFFYDLIFRLKKILKLKKTISLPARCPTWELSS